MIFFRCEDCNEEFPFYVAFKAHEVKFHNSRHILSNSNEKRQCLAFKCEKCPLTYPSQDALNDHLNRVHVMQCNLCTNEFEDFKSLQNHLDVHHSTITEIQNDLEQKSSQKCQVCERLTDDIDEHMEMYHPEKYECKLCDEYFWHQEKLDQHVIDNHKSKDSTTSKNNSKKMYKCGVCKKIFSQMGQIMKHLQSHKRKEFTTFTMSKSEVNL